MPRAIEGWALLARLASNADKLGVSEPAARHAALTLLRQHLLAAASTKADLKALVKLAGKAAVVEALESLVGFEATRLAALLTGVRPETLTSEEARQQLVALVAPNRGAATTPKVEGVMSHRAMGVRRNRGAKR